MDHKPTCSNVRVLPQGPLDGVRLFNALSFTCVLAGVLTIVAVLLPHDLEHYDLQVLVVGLALTSGGFAMRLVRSRTSTAVHLACGAASSLVLTLSWFGMAELGGVHAIFLVMLLMIGASIGPVSGPLALLIAQSTGYAIVLATADGTLGLDRPTQWVVITLGLTIALVYQRRVRATLLATHELDIEVRREQEEQRLLHATRLEHVNDELRAANELKGRFVAMASHELRTPLTSIGGFSRTMLDRWQQITDDDKLRYVGIIDEQAQRLGRLVSDLLLVTHIESGRLISRSRPIHLGAVIDHTLTELDLKEVDINVSGADVMVMADEDHLQQVLLNLLINALMHGRPPISIDVSEEDCTAVVRVSDCGPGVPEEFVPDLFARFTRPDGDCHRSGSTGLGLSIVEGLAQADGGAAWYEPNVPTGAAFCVRLPLVTQATRSAAPSQFTLGDNETETGNQSTNGQTSATATWPGVRDNSGVSGSTPG